MQKAGWAAGKAAPDEGIDRAKFWAGAGRPVTDGKGTEIDGHGVQERRSRANGEDDERYMARRMRAQGGHRARHGIGRILLTDEVGRRRRIYSCGTGLAGLYLHDQERSDG